MALITEEQKQFWANFSIVLFLYGIFFEQNTVVRSLQALLATASGLKIATRGEIKKAVRKIRSHALICLALEVFALVIFFLFHSNGKIDWASGTFIIMALIPFVYLILFKVIFESIGITKEIANRLANPLLYIPLFFLFCAVMAIVLPDVFRTSTRIMLCIGFSLFMTVLGIITGARPWARIAMTTAVVAFTSLYALTGFLNMSLVINKWVLAIRGESRAEVLVNAVVREARIKQQKTEVAIDEVFPEFIVLEDTYLVSKKVVTGSRVKQGRMVRADFANKADVKMGSTTKKIGVPIYDNNTLKYIGIVLGNKLRKVDKTVSAISKKRQRLVFAKIAFQNLGTKTKLNKGTRFRIISGCSLFPLNNGIREEVKVGEMTAPILIDVEPPSALAFKVKEEDKNTTVLLKIL
jgi:hypothetical protein